MNSTNHRSFGAIAALAILFSTVICIGRLPALPVIADDWATYQHDSAHTGRSSASFDLALLKKAWTAPTQYYNPIVVGNSIYTKRLNNGSGSESMTSFNVVNGAQNWSVRYPNTNQLPFALSYPSFAEGLLVFLGGPIAGPEKLYVLDAATGVQKYTVDLPPNIGDALPPTIARNVNNQLVAYVSDSNTASAVNLGSNSGSVMWTVTGGEFQFGSQSIPTVVGDSIILAGGLHYYALDQLTGATNNFLNGGGSRGGGTVVAYDSARSQFYVQDSSEDLLTAYSYTSNSIITQVWQVSGHGNRGGSVAIGADGRIYAPGSGGNLFELDPVDGHVVRTTSGLHLANEVTPALSATSVFLDNQGTTKIYDLATFTEVKSLPGSRGSVNTTYDDPGAIFDFGFVINYGLGTPFDVYLAVPEPSTVLLFATAAVFSLTRRCRKTA